MGKQREPIALILAKDNKHLTKAEIEERQKSEPTAPSDKIVPPGFLSKKQKCRFRKISGELKEIGIMANIDAPALARYIVAETEYEKVTQLLADAMLDADRLKEYTALLTAQDKLFKQCRAAAADLGLTITSRCRLVVPKPEEKKKNPFVSRFNDNPEDASVG